MRIGLIDSSNLLYQCSQAREQPQILKCYLDRVVRLVEELKIQTVVIGNDITKSRYRQSIKHDYKGFRKDVKKKPAQERRDNEARNIREHLPKLFGNSVINGNIYGLEFDDLVGLVNKDFRDKHEIIIISSDRDLLQTGLKQYDPKTHKWLDIPYNYTASQWLQYKILVADSSDGLCGVKGIGDKSASKLITKYGSLKNIMKVTDEPDKKLQKLIDYLNSEKGMEEAKLSYKLVKLFDDCSKMNESEIAQYEVIKNKIENNFFEPYKLTDELEDLYSQLGYSGAYWMMERLSMLVEMNRERY